MNSVRAQRVDGRVLPLAALCSLLAAAPEPNPGLVQGPERTLRVSLGASTGYLTGRSQSPDFVVGGRLAFRAWHPPIVTGGSPLSGIVLFELRHAVLTGRTEAFGQGAVGLQLWRLTMTMGLGFGFAREASGALAPVLPIGMSTGIRVGDLTVSLGVESVMQFGAAGFDTSRLEVRLAAAWELDLGD